nr:uncharacterized protein LOC129485186 [Symphalangus syndactylus]
MGKGWLFQKILASPSVFRRGGTAGPGGGYPGPARAPTAAAFPEPRRPSPRLPEGWSRQPAEPLAKPGSPAQLRTAEPVPPLQAIQDMCKPATLQAALGASLYTNSRWYVQPAAQEGSQCWQLEGAWRVWEHQEHGEMHCSSQHRPTVCYHSLTLCDKEVNKDSGHLPSSSSATSQANLWCLPADLIPGSPKLYQQVTSSTQIRRLATPLTSPLAPRFSRIINYPISVQSSQN